MGDRAREYYLKQAAFWQDRSAALYRHMEHQANMLSYAMSRGDAKRAKEYAKQTAKFQRRGAQAHRLVKDYMAAAGMLRMIAMEFEFAA